MMKQGFYFEGKELFVPYVAETSIGHVSSGFMLKREKKCYWLLNRFTGEQMEIGNFDIMSQEGGAKFWSAIESCYLRMNFNNKDYRMVGRFKIEANKVIGIGSFEMKGNVCYLHTCGKTINLHGMYKSDLSMICEKKLRKVLEEEGVLECSQMEGNVV